MRNIHMENGKWEYSIGEQFAVIKAPNKSKRWNISLSKILHTTPDNIERDKFKGNFNGVKPKHIRCYIENTLY